MAKVKKEYLFIAHVCLNSLKDKKHVDYCERGFVAESPKKSTCSEQCWRYCNECVSKGYPVITVEDRLKFLSKRAIKNNKKEIGLNNLKRKP